jgi:hypothetical protein
MVMGCTPSSNVSPGNGNTHDSLTAADESRATRAGNTAQQQQQPSANSMQPKLPAASSKPTLNNSSADKSTAKVGN